MRHERRARIPEGDLRWTPSQVVKNGAGKVMNSTPDRAGHLNLKPISESELHRLLRKYRLA